MNLQGVIETHVHASPDVRVRSVDDWGIVESAVKAGIRAVVIKNHFVPTMCRAADVQRLSDKVQIFGGIALNRSVGGVNPYAVDIALRLGAKVVWLPTHDSAAHQRCHGKTSGLEIKPGTEEERNLRAIIRMVEDHGAALATGHLSPEEIMLVADEAVRAGLKRLVITHPELRVVNMPISQQKELASAGCFFERVYAQPEGGGKYHVNVEDNYRAMTEVGFDSTIVSTDGGQVENPFWTVSLQNYINILDEKGVTEEQLNVMCKKNPAYVLGLDE